jgi:agmatinase
MKTFGGIPAEFAMQESAKVSILPVPYDGTSTWGKGADKGPKAFFTAAENMELYDIETDSEVYKQGIFIEKELSGFKSPEEMVDAVHEKTKKIIDSGKLFTMIGGEHSVSIGAIRGMIEKFEDLSVIQIDAHSDLRPEYEGSACNHACALHEASKYTNLIQVGIRSMDSSEIPYLNKEKVFWAHKIHNSTSWIDQVLSMCTNNVYVTIDLDAFDPSILPGTGTPEPGGLNWYQVNELLLGLTMQCNIVGFDITELSPIKGEHISEFFTAKLYYRFLSMIFNK